MLLSSVNRKKTGGGVPDVKPLTSVEEAMLPLIKDVQVSGVPGLRDPHPASDDEEDLAAGDIDVTLPSRPASPRPSGTQNLQISSPPEPLSPDTDTEGVVEIASEPAPPQADDHQYSQPPQAGRNQRGSSRREGTLAPEMLQVHEDIRNSLSDLTECITTYLPGIATSLNELASRRLV
ncbi:uncharacterized protein LOC123514968 isoform X1 [Portunus trituberculatus]|uniref:uncharacterized protein LOC123501423 isoform X1 n=2 Tax=Portunus trituberculatus TaxID=210409 RepID=UPI001E1D1F66|nr:uncharacterized protein LOC123501423 isoform X1 [Portunus trituberculatus]XP_045127925.1 uncharacterized protein LOC123514246 isoform X1 [Portunus trituberculatus]XP_045129191.1 uncharacterized protein LOC123514968 isoform X1 [Portunus trituberculatus]